MLYLGRVCDMSVLGFSKARHLVSRTGIGEEWDVINRASKLTNHQAVNQLLKQNNQRTPAPPRFSSWKKMSALQKNITRKMMVRRIAKVEGNTLQTWWIKHLLTMSSGINFDESYKSPFGHMAKAYYGSDIKKLNEDYTVTEIPGETWRYLGGNTIILSFILEKVTNMPLSEYMSEKIWKPVGAKNQALWSLDKKDGLEKAYCCFYSNARDFARIGKLVKDGGLWNKQRIITEKYITAATSPAYNLKEKNGKPVDFYGYQMWMTYYKDFDVFYARGIKGQYIITIPEKDIVIVRLGHQRAPKLENYHPADLYYYIDFALEQ